VVFNNLKLSVNNLLIKEKISKERHDLKVNIFKLIDEVIEEFDIDDIHILDKLQNKDKSYRNELLQDIVKQCSALGKIKRLISLSYLLFGDYDYYINFLNKDRLDKKPELYVLFRIIFNTLTWDVKLFKSLAIDIDGDTLLEYQAKIEFIIKEFVFSNKFRNNYVKELFERNGVLRTKEYLYLEYDTIFSMWLSCAVYYDDSNITFEDVKNFFDFDLDPTGYLLYNASNNIGSHTLKKIYYKIKGLLNKIIIGGDFNNFNYTDKLLIFRECFDQIYYYSRIRNVRVLPAKYDIYRIFQNHYVITFHVVELLKRNLGFDILFFKALDNSIFESGSWVRHHFKYKDYIIKYELGELKSSKVEDILLTSDKYHSSYRMYERTKQGEESIAQILKAFDIFKKYDGKITERMIKKVLEKLDLQWVYYKWKSQGQKQFELMVKEFNKRKDFLKSHSIQEFLVEYYKIIYEMYFDKYIQVNNKKNEFKGILF